MSSTLALSRPSYTTALQVFLGSCFIALCAQISIPLFFTPVPLTGQTFAIMLVGATLGPKRGALAALAYLLEASVGLPVLAGGFARPLWFFGLTGGYLLTFPLEAYLFGHFAEKNQPIAYPFISLVQLALGSLWLGLYVGFSHALTFGFYPFLFVEMGKALLVYLLTRKS